MSEVNANEVTPTAPIGVLERVDRAEIAGWAAVPGFPDLPVRVELRFDNRLAVVLQTQHLRPDVARKHGVTKAGFRLNPKQGLLDALGPSTAVTAHFEDGRELMRIDGLKTLRGNGLSTTLWEQFDRGMRLSPKSGDIYLPLAKMDDYAALAGSAYKRAAEVFRCEFSLDLFAAYGSMLGLVREGRFLAHDDDFDAGYFSRQSTVEAVAHEFVEIGSRLRELGAELALFESGNMHVTFPNDPIKLDLFCFSIIDETLRAYQVHRPSFFHPHVPFHPIRYETVDYMVPACAVQILEATYGADWKTPNPAFQWAPSDANKAAMWEMENAIRLEKAARAT